ncbi:MAG TPA: ribbon-helix-helix domain-containing protein [Spirochaetota bacterium]|nr:ribbon-helix-helix domain-containing protein [Spirochaetota bacterium]HPC42649.1 ribbon-helix-helix domain-containing protein [Spirochaetota bacterium]HPL16256.1 ribbon-helix-helix domain-containing protein [Spirochaetota bacterium]HQF08431.1 ribbon-helix-helix domain-containing protein [Spirochaetota bacterium]HQH99069.1 ribbon-helix-helix domain-containing protein [Spirochaetota bacterium]
MKTSITLSKELLKEIDRIVTKSGNRSVFIEEAVKAYLKGKKRQLRGLRDMEIINQSSGDLNKESEDILSYQVKV